MTESTSDIFSTTSVFDGGVTASMETGGLTGLSRTLWPTVTGHGNLSATKPRAMAAHA